MVLVVLLGLCTVETETECAVEAVDQAKVLAFAVELEQLGRMAVVDFDHPVEQIPAEVEAVDEGLALPVEAGLWEQQVVACTGHGVSSEVELHTLMTVVASVGVGQEEAYLPGQMQDCS